MNAELNDAKQRGWRSRLQRRCTRAGFRRGAFLLVALWMAFVAGRGVDDAAPVGPPAARSCSRGQTSVTEPLQFGVDNGPTTYRHDVPVGFAGNEGGARAAGIAYATEVEERMFSLSDGAVEGATRQMSAEGRSGVMAAIHHESLDAWRAVLKPGQGQAWWVVSPLASKIESFTGEGARVSVWVAFIVSRPGAVSPRVWFGIRTIDLVREQDDWKVFDQSLVSGPTPQAAADAKPTDASELNERLAGFSPGWLAR